MPEIAAEIILDDEIALVDGGDERKLVHVLQHRAILVVHDVPSAVAPGEPGDAGEVTTLRDFLDR